MPEVTVTSNSKPGKKVCIERAPEISNGRSVDPGNMMGDHVQEALGSNTLPIRANNNSFGQDLAQHLASNNQQAYQMGNNNTPRSTQDHAINDMMNSYVDNANPNASSMVRKRESQDGPMSPLSSLNSKRARPVPTGLEGMQQLQPPVGQHMDAFRGSEFNWKAQLLQQQQSPMARGLPYANTGNQKFSQQVFDGALNQDPVGGQQQGMRFAPKEEQVEAAKLDGSDMQTGDVETGHLDQQQQQKQHQQRSSQNAYGRTGFPQTQWNNLGQQHAEKDGRKEEQGPKRKSAQSPRLPAGALVQSPLSGEFSGGSGGSHFGPSAQREKSVGSAVVNPSLASGGDPLQRHHQAQLGPKRKQNLVAKNQANSMVGSPANAAMNVGSTPVGAQPIDKDILEKFSKIEMVAMRYVTSSRLLSLSQYISCESVPLE